MTTLQRELAMKGEQGERVIGLWRGRNSNEGDSSGLGWSQSVMGFLGTGLATSKAEESPCGFLTRLGK